MSYVGTRTTYMSITTQCTVSARRRSSVAVWGGGMSASGFDTVSSCSLTRAMDGRIVRCGIISSCQSAATS